MIIDRQVAATKVEGLLGGVFPQNEFTREWALYRGLPEYEAVVKTDPPGASISFSRSIIKGPVRFPCRRS